MHQYLGLRQGAVDQQLADPLPARLLGLAEAQAQCAADVPFGEQFDLTAQQRDIVAGQRCVHRQALQGQQRIDGIGEQGIGVVLVNDVQVCLAPQVTQQQEAAPRSWAWITGTFTPAVASR